MLKSISTSDKLREYYELIYFISLCMIPIILTYVIKYKIQGPIKYTARMSYIKSIDRTMKIFVFFLWIGFSILGIYTLFNILNSPTSSHSKINKEVMTDLVRLEKFEYLLKNIENEGRHIVPLFKEFENKQSILINRRNTRKINEFIRNQTDIIRDLNIYYQNEEVKGIYDKYVSFEEMIEKIESECVMTEKSMFSKLLNISYKGREECNVYEKTIDLKLTAIKKMILENWNDTIEELRYESNIKCKKYIRNGVLEMVVNLTGSETFSRVVLNSFEFHMGALGDLLYDIFLQYIRYTNDIINEHDDVTYEKNGKTLREFYLDFFSGGIFHYSMYIAWVILGSRGLQHNIVFVLITKVITHILTEEFMNNDLTDTWSYRIIRSIRIYLDMISIWCSYICMMLASFGMIHVLLDYIRNNSSMLFKLYTINQWNIFCHIIKKNMVSIILFILLQSIIHIISSEVKYLEWLSYESKHTKKQRIYFEEGIECEEYSELIAHTNLLSKIQFFIEIFIWIIDIIMITDLNKIDENFKCLDIKPFLGHLKKPLKFSRRISLPNYRLM